MNTTIIDTRYVSADHIEAARLRSRIIAVAAACSMGSRRPSANTLGAWATHP